MLRASSSLWNDISTAQGDYLLTAVEHTASLEGEYRRAPTAPSTFYENRFRCLPTTLPFRPARVTPRPHVAGTQTATVVGPKGSEIFCDKYGRVKLLFRWDRQNQPHGNSSGWVRVAQASAGGQYGSIQIPRVGHDVIVDFLDGDPDQPIIVGSVYNGAHMPPFSLPANQAQTGFKTRSQPEGQGSNFSGLMFDDSTGQEHVHMHSERFMTQSTEGSLFVNAAQAHYVNVGQLHNRQVGGIPGTNHSPTAGGQAGAHGAVALSNMSATSSGSGGGAASSSGYASTPFSWNASVEGGAAADLDLIIGWNCDNTLGMETRTTIGSYRETMINAPTSAVSLVKKLFGSKGFAKASVVLGPLTEIHYGSKIQVNRGTTWTATRVLDSTTGGVEATAAATACKLLGASYSGWMVLGMLWPALQVPLGELTSDINSMGLGTDATWAADHALARRPSSSGTREPRFSWTCGLRPRPRSRPYPWQKPRFLRPRLRARWNCKGYRP